MKRNNRPSEYAQAHYWLRRNYGSPKICEAEDCLGISKTFDWALKKGKKQEKNRDNYIRLCRQCHMRYDWNEEKTKRFVAIGHTKEANEKKSETRKRLWKNSEYKEMMKKALKGKTGTYKRTPEMKTGIYERTEEGRKNMSIAHLGKKYKPRKSKYE